jgi:hypothetical protein
MIGTMRVLMKGYWDGVMMNWTGYWLVVGVYGVVVVVVVEFSSPGDSAR